MNANKLITDDYKLTNYHLLAEAQCYEKHNLGNICQQNYNQIHFSIALCDFTYSLLVFFKKRSIL